MVSGTSTNRQAHGFGPACFIGGWLLSAYQIFFRSTSTRLVRNGTIRVAKEFRILVSLYFALNNAACLL